MKFYQIIVCILFSITAQSQFYTLEYQEKRNLEVPDNVRNNNPLLLQRVKEIVEEKRNTIYLTRVHTSPECIYSAIDSIYYESGFVNKQNIRTKHNIIEYFNKDKFIYIKDPYVGSNTYKVEPNNLNFKEYRDIKKRIGNFNCHKIDLEFLSDKFELWVTEETKAKGGPLVFSFLPYLIVEVQSDKKSFRLVKIKASPSPTKLCHAQFENIKSYKDYENRKSTR